ncbi:MAG: ATP-binding cassette domain-containing protein [Anaerolineae bacterium]
MTDLMIQAQGLTKHYRKLEAVRGIDLEVRQGEIFGLVGPDGAGKTTTIQMLTGILTPTSGEARVTGVDVVRQADHLGGKIGYMSEGFTLYGTLSVEENLDFFADLYGVPSDFRHERKAQLLQFARLEEARHRRAEHLSGGMKKKLALACTLMYSPQVLLLDEPTTGVDPVSRRDFWKILYDWLQAGEGLTIFVSTPYMDEAERFDRVALMHQGRFIATDTPQALKARLNGEMLDLKAEPQATALQVLKSTEGVSHVQAFGERLHLLVPAGNGTEQVSSVEATLAAAGVTLLDQRQSKPTLEDVFVASIPQESLTGEAAGQRVEGEMQIPEIGTQFSPVSPLEGMDTTSSIAASRIQSSDDKYAVSVEKLTRRFGDFTAVDGISFNVHSGEIFGFLGPNGSGKTTTIRMLTGLLPPTSGRGSVAGFDILREQARIKPEIGYMSQKFSLYSDLTVAENIDFYAGVYNVPRKRRAERKAWVLDMAGLRGKEGLLTRDLSGGWKQRLALGCAILHQPRILFLDEPTSGVDPISRRAFWDLIYELSAQGVPICVTTHYMDEAEHCHTLGLLYYGQIIALGSPAGMKANMKAGQMLEIDVSDALKASNVISGLPGVQSSAPYGDKLHVLVWGDADDDVDSLTRCLAAAGLPPRQIERIEFSLEDLFIIFIEMQEAGRRARMEAVE